MKMITPLRLSRHGRVARPWIASDISVIKKWQRTIHVDGRPRLSNAWLPTQATGYEQKNDGHENLVRAGIVSKSHAGVFHLLPLGQRIQDKLVALIKKHMSSLGASQVELSTISSETLWEESGRLAKVGPELFRFQDRKQGRYLLGPTHEEEITALVGRKLQSYKKDLPLRLYQITKKFRDELRPRFGLLRSREFLMKDLYTFDYSVDTALHTYSQVRNSYEAIFNALKLPVRAVKGSSGDMGGDLSHEYQITTPLGEDSVISCNKCDYIVNEEVAQPRLSSSESKVQGIRCWRGISKDKRTLINVWYPKMIDGREYDMEDINIHAVKSAFPDLDSSIEDVHTLWLNILSSSARVSGQLTLLNLVDDRISTYTKQAIENETLKFSVWPKLVLDSRVPTNDVLSTTTSQNLHSGQGLQLLRTLKGDPCPKCASGTLDVQNSLELGHTFHLGTRYSEPLDATIAVPSALLETRSSPTTETIEAIPGALAPASSDETTTTTTTTTSTVVNTTAQRTIPLQMGCHGIGVSRIIGAAANHLSDKKGLNWPRVIAPYEVLVIPPNQPRNNNSSATTIATSTDNSAPAPQAVSSTSSDGEMVLDLLQAARFQPPAEIPAHLLMSHHTQLDPVLDDRELTLPWKLKDADLIGYPVIVVLGREWTAARLVEVQCRRLGIKENVQLGGLPEYLKGLLDQL